MNATKFAELICILAIYKKHSSHYVRILPNTFIDLLHKFHGINIGRRWHFQCLHDLEYNGFIRRKLRHYHGEYGEVKSLASMFVLRTKALKFLDSKQVSGAYRIMQQMISWLRKDEKRFPDHQDIDDSIERTPREKALGHISEILRSLKCPSDGLVERSF